MDGEKVRVLLVGKSEEGFSCVKEHLRRLDCHCEFAPSCSYGAGLAMQGSFDLILCEVGMEDFKWLEQLFVRLGVYSDISLWRMVAGGCQ